MFDRFQHRKQKADKMFSVKPTEDGDSSDTISWSGSPPDSPLAHKRKSPVTTIPETPPQNLARVSNHDSGRSHPCAGRKETLFGLRSPQDAASSSPKRTQSVDENSHTTSSLNSPRGRLHFAAEGAENGAFAHDMQKLADMFPDASHDQIDAILKSCDGDLDQAISSLLADDGVPPVTQRASKRRKRILSSCGDSDDGGVSVTAVVPAKRARRLSSSACEDTARGSTGAGPAKRVLRSTSNAEPAKSPVRMQKHKQGRRCYLALSDDDDADNSVISIADDDGDDEEYEAEQPDVDMWPGVKKEHVLHYLNTAKSAKLEAVMNASRAKQVRSRRPFASWWIMIEQLAEAKLPLDRIISKTNDLVEDILVMRALMEKCDRVSKRLKGLVDGKGSKLLPQPPNLNTSMTLSPYQRIGLSWMMMLYKETVNGILADEMGLGKTVQAIAYMAQAMQQGVKGPFLIVVPSSTIDNWKREIALWCPDLDAGLLMYRGSKRERSEAMMEFEDNPGDYTAILTSYSTCTGAPPDRKFLRHCNFSLCVLDEGHMLKNMMSQRYAYMSRICPPRRLLLTGTPLQNNLTELLSLLHFTMPDIFSPTQECIRRLFSAANGSAAEGSSSADADLDQDDVDRIARSAHHIMQPFVLRRLKADVLKHLPPKQHHVSYCDMPTNQRNLYKEKIQGAHSALALAALTELRKVACHPVLVRRLYTDAILREMAVKIYNENPSHYNVEKVEEDMTVMSDFELHKLCLMHDSLHGHELKAEDILYSAKFQELDKMLPQLKTDGHRVLLFSQFVIMLNVMETYLEVRGHRFIRLDGSTPVAERQALIDEYNNDNGIFIFLLSTKAGGLGINLTAADYAILYDIDLNPHNDRQAEDRCHRVGQTKPVTIVRLICRNTVEEVMMRVAERKLKLEKDVTLGDSGENPEDASSLLSEAMSL